MNIMVRFSFKATSPRYILTKLLRPFQNELIGAIKFIKMFAWERQWTKRVIDARETEMKVTIRDRWNNVRLQDPVRWVIDAH